MVVYKFSPVMRPKKNDINSVRMSYDTALVAIHQNNASTVSGMLVMT